ncbi:MAG: hypothetical protein M1827_002811 [Pycnora praestabilis]|nr:MAG: hypothetical protein M1827_002811 [Pycnora praestabilis]
MEADLIPKPYLHIIRRDAKTWPAMEIDLTGLMGLKLKIDVGGYFGKIEYRVSIGLDPLMERPNLIRTQAQITMRHERKGVYPGQIKGEVYDIVVILYGKQKDAIIIGIVLDQKYVRLRKPLSVDHEIEFCNPHASNARADEVGKAAP